MTDNSDQLYQSAYEIPLQYQRAFGAGIKRKRIEFVPQSASPTSSASATPERSSSVQDVYLSIVLPNQNSSSRGRVKQRLQQPHTSPVGSYACETVRTKDPPEVEALCDICQLPIDANQAAVPHKASLAHQVCLQHSHPPSALDRRRKGLAYLSSYGWDPDARTGLGAAAEGRLYPIQPRVKRDKGGIGAAIGQVEAKKKEVRLDAGKVRRLEESGRRKGKLMEQLFYGRDDVNKLLGLEL